MQILLDECVTKHLKPKLLPHEVSTVREMGWSGINNGKLMSLGVENNFDILKVANLNWLSNQHSATNIFRCNSALHGIA